MIIEVREEDRAHKEETMPSDQQFQRMTDEVIQNRINLGHTEGAGETWIIILVIALVFGAIIYWKISNENKASRAQK